ncbi:MAG: hypothetical protein O3B73_01860 [bacterium]|nr:hypothetical protein [bacterium]
MPRHTPMDSDPSILNASPSEILLRPGIPNRRLTIRPMSILRWLLIAASISAFFFI